MQPSIVSVTSVLTLCHPPDRKLKCVYRASKIAVLVRRSGRALSCARSYLGFLDAKRRGYFRFCYGQSAATITLVLSLDESDIRRVSSLMCLFLQAQNDVAMLLCLHHPS